MQEVKEEPEAPTLDLDTGEPAAEGANDAAADDDARKAEPRRGRKSHPIVPSWEDVLLGVRSHR